MCGIIGYSGAREAAPILVEGLRKLEYRGYDSAGIAVLDPTRQPSTQLTRCVGKIAALAECVDNDKISGTSGIGHTRWATHGVPSEANAHPQRVGHICVVHNGIIENHQLLRDRLIADGREFRSDTDTETIAHLVDRAYAKSGDLHQAVRTTVAELEGAWAICVTHDEHPLDIVVARHLSPLLIGLADSTHPNRTDQPEIFVASDVAPLLAYTRVVVDLEDGDTAYLNAEHYEILDIDGKEGRRPKRQIDWSPLAAEKQGFKHFMLKEIFEQPRSIRDTLMGRLPAGSETIDLNGLEPAMAAASRITLLACGTSWHAGLAGKYLIEQLAKVPVEVDLASEFRYRNPIVRPGDVAIAISQSGETVDTLAAMTEAKRLGANSVAVCNVIGSTIARSADHVLYTHAGPEISVASTKAFTSQLTMLTLLATRLGEVTGALTADRVTALVEGLRALPVVIDSVLDQRAALKTIARRYLHARDFLYLGRGLGFPVALEGALKLKEISYVHAEGYAAGEMKHGPIALIDEHVPVVLMALRGGTYEKAISNLEVVRSRGGRVIAVATAGDDQIGDLADDVILVPDVDEMLQPIVASVPLQLLAYYIADLRGTDVDQPRNLAKSVTVE
ncbi:MAG: glutamine--fructose-6-phosphate transaminase (isomerizing) [Myxococcales bacterium FL481]|nr:MAG: glutamine--fructose-6-phosphate transaminase (isomerizing) [Myxococcales bacterium FL481]